MNRVTTFATAAIAALGIALTPNIAQAQDGEDIGKIIAGLAVAGIIAKALDDRDDGTTAASSVILGSPDFNRYRNSNSYSNSRRVIEGRVRPYEREHHNRWPRLGKDFKREPLPRSCLVTVRTSEGVRLAYGARCLNQKFDYANRLPSSCQIGVRSRYGYRLVYGSRCLGRDGWRVAHR